MTSALSRTETTVTATTATAAAAEKTLGTLGPRTAAPPRGAQTELTHYESARGAEWTGGARSRRPLSVRLERTMNVGDRGATPQCDSRV